MGSGVSRVSQIDDDSTWMRLIEVKVKNGTFNANNGELVQIENEAHEMEIFPNWLITKVAPNSEAERKGVKPGWVTWQDHQAKSVRVCSSKILFSPEYIQTTLDLKALAETLRETLHITGNFYVNGNMIVGVIEGVLSEIDDACEMIIDQSGLDENSFKTLVDIPESARMFPELQVKVMRNVELHEAISRMFFTMRAGVGSDISSFEESVFEEVQMSLRESHVMDEKVVERALESNDFIRSKVDARAKKKLRREMKKAYQDQQYHPPPELDDQRRYNSTICCGC